MLEILLTLVKLMWGSYLWWYAWTKIELPWSTFVLAFVFSELISMLYILSKEEK